MFILECTMVLPCGAVKVFYYKGIYQSTVALPSDLTVILYRSTLFFNLLDEPS